MATRTLVYNGRGEVERIVAPFEAPGLSSYTAPAANAAETRFDYDALGRLALQTHPDGTGWTLIYSGFTTTLNDEAGNRRVTIGDAYGRTIEEQIYQGTATLLTRRSYTYDGLGRLLTKTLNGNSNTTLSMTYDRMGRKTSMSDPDSGSGTTPGSWNYTYDPEDNLLSQTDPRGNAVSFTYDSLDRLLTKRHPDLGQISFTYDLGANGMGRLSSVGDLSGSSIFTYDSHGNVLSRTQTIRSQSLGDKTLTFNFTYDSADRLTGTTYPQDGTISSETVTSTYNDTGQLTSVSGSSPYVSDVRYDLFGRADPDHVWQRRGGREELPWVG